MPPRKLRDWMSLTRVDAHDDAGKIGQRHLTDCSAVYFSGGTNLCDLGVGESPHPGVGVFSAFQGAAEGELKLGPGAVIAVCDGLYPRVDRLARKRCHPYRKSSNGAHWSLP